MRKPLALLLGVDLGRRAGLAFLDVDFEAASHTSVLVVDKVELVGVLRVNLLLDLFRVGVVASSTTVLHGHRVGSFVTTLFHLFLEANAHRLFLNF